MTKVIMQGVFFILIVGGICRSAGCATSSAVQCRKNTKAEAIENILKDLNSRTKELKSYRCRLEYLTSQPLFESKTLRKGELFYRKSDEKSVLRVNFRTIKQDEAKEQKYIEQYIFDGLWLTHIDYQLKEIKIRQLAEANEPGRPTDIFEMVSEHFPIIGFSKTDELKKQFDIKLVGKEKDIHLNLKVKPDSIYKDDYTTVDFWIDAELYLPAKIVAVSTEEDIREIRFIKPKVNKKIDKKIFDVEVPKGFGVEKVPLKKKGK